MSRRPIAELVADIDEVLTTVKYRQDWLTLPEVMEALTESYNTNPACTGAGLFRVNGKGSFSAYARRCRQKLYTYPDVSAALESYRYPSRIGVRWNNDRGDVEVLTWGPRCD